MAGMGQYGVIDQFRSQHLHGHLGVVPGHAEVHHAHPACAQPGGQPVASDPRRVIFPQWLTSQRIPPSASH
jgi:hypothetical protein